MVQPFLQESNPAIANPIKGSLFTDSETFVQEFKDIFVQMSQQNFVQKFKDISSFQISENICTQFKEVFLQRLRKELAAKFHLSCSQIRLGTLANIMK